MRPSIAIRRVSWAARLFVAFSFVFVSTLAARADVIYTLNATTQSGALFTGTFTIPIPDPAPDPPFTHFTGLITQSTAGGVVIDTYTPTESDVEGSVTRFLFAGTGQNDRVNDELLLFVEGSAFTTDLTVCTTTHVCNCTPAATCPSPNPGNTISFASACLSEDARGRCLAVDEQDFATATLTGVSTTVTPEPSSLLLLTTGMLFLPAIARRRGFNRRDSSNASC